MIDWLLSKKSLPLLWTFVYEAEYSFCLSKWNFQTYKKHSLQFHFSTLQVVQDASLLDSDIKSKDHVPECTFLSALAKLMCKFCVSD